MPLCEFGAPGPMRDRLIAAVVCGEKTATSSLHSSWVADREPLPEPGSRQSVIDSAGRPVAVIEITSIEVLPLESVTDQHAIEEGEGFVSAAEWRDAHERFWRSECDDPREQPDRLPGDTAVVFERFKLCRPEAS